MELNKLKIGQSVVAGDADKITVIDYSKELSDIKNLQDLPPETAKFLKTEIDRFESHGFQELIGYQGRQAVISMGGHWTGHDENAKFIITSYGTGNKDFGIPKQWSDK